MDRSFWELAAESVLRRKKSSILIFLVLTVSFAFAILAVSLVSSISKTNQSFLVNTYGEWYLGIPRGLDEDAGWLEQTVWAQQIGCARSYGVIQSASGGIGFGTLDEDFLEIGRIGLESGHFPVREDEIVLEADDLNALGLDYTLGQQITLSIQVPCGEQEVRVEQTYTLCGVLREYSDIWFLNQNQSSQLLVSAVVTESAARQVLESARALCPDAFAIPQYFITVRENLRLGAAEELRMHLLDTIYDRPGHDSTPCQNVIVYQKVEQEEYDAFYLYMIAAVSVLAVFCVYLMRLPSDLQSFAVLRSIGGTRSQLAALLLAETLLLWLPAAAVGALCGAGATWGALRWLIYSSSVPVDVSVPFGALLAVILLWTGAALLARLLTLAFLLWTPLTGRFQLQTRRAHLLRRVQGGLILILLGCFGLMILLPNMNSLELAVQQEYWSLCPSYTIYASSFSGRENQTITLAETELLKKIPGVDRVDGFAEMNLWISFPGQEEMPVYFYALDADGWSETIDFGDSRQAFQDGELLLLLMPESQPSALLPEDTLTLHIYDAEMTLLLETDAPVQVQWMPDFFFNRTLSLSAPYTVVGSFACLRQLLDQMPDGAQWGKYTVGQEFGYSRVLAMSDLYTSNFSTDITATQICSQLGLGCDNRRAQFAARVQNYSQTITMLYAVSSCIAVVVVLVLADLFLLETEQERPSFQILRALGMSRTQLYGRVLGRALARSLAAAALGWGLYIAYALRDLWSSPALWGEGFSALVQDWQANGCTPQFLALETALCLAAPLVLSLAANWNLMKGKVEV